MTSAPARSLLDSFTSRQLPDWLRGPPPPTWNHSADEWEGVRMQALEFFKLKSAFDLALMIAERGFYCDEVASGELRPGARLSGMNGAVLRPLAGTVEDLSTRASTLYSHLRTARIQLYGGLDATVESVATGTWRGSRKAAEQALSEAEMALKRAHNQYEENRSEHLSRPRIRVLTPFRSTGGREWKAGEYVLSQDDLDELLDWQDKNESYAKLRNWDMPSGFQKWHHSRSSLPHPMETSQPDTREDARVHNGHLARGTTLSLASDAPPVKRRGPRNPQLHSTSAMFLRTQRLRQRVSKLKRRFPQLREKPVYLLERLSELDQIIGMVYIPLAENGPTDAKGDPTPLLRQYRALIREWRALALSLGILEQDGRKDPLKDLVND